MIDLKNWNLTIPVGAKIISTEKLNAGYKDEFFIPRDNGDIAMRAPSSGDGIKPTEHSEFPRCELRETKANGDKARWPLKSAPCHTLRLMLRIDSLAADGKVIIGQAHGDGEHPIIKINGTVNKNNPKLIDIEAQLREKLDGDEDKPVFRQVAIGEWLAYELQLLADGKFFLYDGPSLDQLKPATDAEGILKAQGYQFNEESYAKDGFYFKAGTYSQTKVGGKGVGQITYRVIEVEHGERPAQPGGKYATGTPVETPDPEPTTPPVVTPTEPKPPIQPLPDPAPETPATGPAAQIQEVLQKNKAGTMTKAAAKTALNKIGDAIDKMPDGAEQKALYAQAGAAKAALK